MELIDQVCPFDQAKILNELGAPQESYFVWVVFEGERSMTSRVSYEEMISVFDSNVTEAYAAYTVGEMGMLLPLSLSSIRETYAGDVWQGYYEINEPFGSEQSTEAICRAEMLIYFYRNRKIKVL